MEQHLLAQPSTSPLLQLPDIEWCLATFFFKRIEDESPLQEWASPDHHLLALPVLLILQRPTASDVSGMYFRSPL